MANEYRVDVRREARRLWLTGRFIYEKIAARLEIPRADTIRDWRRAGGWGPLANDISAVIRDETKAAVETERGCSAIVARARTTLASSDTSEPATMAQTPMSDQREAGDESRSREYVRARAYQLAQDAAGAWRERPDADFVGIIAEAGTVEARRCRTTLEQGTGVEMDAQGFFGVLTPQRLVQILDRHFPAEARDWLFAGERGKELRFVVCTMSGFRVASAPLPKDAP